VGVGAVGGETFEREVLESEEPVIVDFWAPWCAPCLAVAPLLEQVANERHDELKVVKVNVDEEPELAARFGIASIPTILLFEAGNPIARTVGARESPSSRARSGSVPRSARRDLRSSGFRGRLFFASAETARSSAREDQETGGDTERPSAHRGKRDAAVVGSRRQRLLDAGFSVSSSERLARDERIDLHALLDLVQSGCPPELAVRTLAPLDDKPGRG
jgi:thioredoxin 1